MNGGILIGAALGAVTLATPLLLAATGETIAQKAGVVNVGLEGMMLAGAFAATIGALNQGAIIGNPYWGLLVGALAGMALAGLFAVFAVRLAANQVVVGVVVNLLALGLTGTIYRAKFGATGAFLRAATLPAFFGSVNVLTLLAFLAAPLSWLWLYRTRRGLELRACGEQPIAAEASGVGVLRTRTLAVLFGGAMAGIAGAFLSVGNTGTFAENMTAGRGFIALAIVTSGRWNPYGCLIAALIFGAVSELQAQGQALGLHLPFQLFLALPYLVTLLALMRGGRQTQAPAALGRPYRRV